MDNIDQLTDLIAATRSRVVQRDWALSPFPPTTPPPKIAASLKRGNRGDTERVKAARARFNPRSAP